MKEELEKMLKFVEDIGKSLKRFETMLYVSLIIMFFLLLGMLYCIYRGQYYRIGNINPQGKRKRLSVSEQSFPFEMKKKLYTVITHNPLLAEVSVFLVVLQSMSTVVLVTVSTFNGGLPYPHRVVFPVLADSRI